MAMKLYLNDRIVGKSYISPTGKQLTKYYHYVK